jgi:hypothetical protein
MIYIFRSKYSIFISLKRDAQIGIKALKGDFFMSKTNENGLVAAMLLSGVLGGKTA